MAIEEVRLAQRLMVYTTLSDYAIGVQHRDSRQGG